MGKYQTEQRIILMDFFEKNPDHNFTARQIYENIKDSGISIGAVYRNLSDLAISEKIQRVAGKNSREIFYRYTGSEKCMGCLHLSCIKCGKTFHMSKEAAEKISETISEYSNFSINVIKSVIYGVCSDCDE